MERTLVLIKPDGVRRRLIGEIVARFERKGLQIVAMKLIRFSRELAKEHYEAHVGKPFFPGLIDFITSGPLVAMVLEGLDAITVTRNMMGATSGRKAAAGSIRGDYGISETMNLVHGSDSPETAEVEINRIFSEDEFVEYDGNTLEGYYSFEDGKPV